MLVQPLLKAIVKFICKLEGKKNDAPSKYNSKAKLKVRLQECDPCWTKYFLPSDDGEDTNTSDDDDGDAHSASTSADEDNN